MQVSATLIAAQQAAREARARMTLPQAQAPQATAKANFASALQDLTGAAPAATPTTSAAPASQPAQASAPSGRLGQHVNILV